MKVKARKLLSLLLTLAMVAGMFVLPASATLATGDADSGIYVLDATGFSSVTGLADGTYVAAGTGNYFGVNSGSIKTANGVDIGTASDDYYLAKASSKVSEWNTGGSTGINSSKFRRAIKITTKYDNAVVKMWWYHTSTSDSRSARIFNAEAVADENILWTSSNSANGGYYDTYTVAKAGTTIYIGSLLSISYRRIEVVDKAAVDPSAPDYTITKGAESNGTFTVSPADKAKENATVTVTVDPAEGYKVADNGVTVTDSENGSVTVTKKDATTYTFTMPAKAVTVNVTFEAGHEATPLTYKLSPAIQAVKNAYPNGTNVSASVGSVWNSPYFKFFAKDTANLLFRPDKTAIDTGKAEYENGVEFTTEAKAKVVIELSSTGSNNWSSAVLEDPNGAVVAKSATSGAELNLYATTDFSQAEATAGTDAKYFQFKTEKNHVTLTYEDLPAGNYKLYAPAVTNGQTGVDTRGFRLYEITVTEEDGTPKEDLEVKAVTGVTIDPATLTLEVGKNSTLSVQVEPSDAIDRTVTWTSSNETVATVESNGKVTAKAGGTAKITATSNFTNTVFGECTVTVTVPLKTMKNASPEPQSKSYKPGQTLYAQVKVVNEDGSEITVPVTYKYAIVTNGEVGEYTSTKPSQTNAGTTTYMFKATADGYEEFTSVEARNIHVSKADPVLSIKAKPDRVKQVNDADRYTTLTVTCDIEGADVSKIKVTGKNEKTGEAVLDSKIVPVEGKPGVYTVHFSDPEVDTVNYVFTASYDGKNADGTDNKNYNAADDKTARISVINSSVVDRTYELNYDSEHIKITYPDSQGSTDEKVLYGAGVEAEAINIPEGKKFDHWESADLNPTDADWATKNPTKFAMPGHNVELKVVFKDKTEETDPANRTQLSALLRTAEEWKEVPEVDTDAANVDKGVDWVKAEDKADFQTAIDAAQAVASNDKSTQAQVNEAVEKLDKAIADFKATWKKGTKSGGSSEPTTTKYILDPTTLTASADKEDLTTAELREDQGKNILGFTKVTKRWSTTAGVYAIDLDKPANGGALTITIPAGATATVLTKLTSNGGENVSYFELRKNGVKVNNVENLDSVTGSTDAAVDVNYTGLTEGTYTLLTPSDAETASKRGVRVVYLEVAVTSGGGDTPAVPDTEARKDLKAAVAAAKEAAEAVKVSKTNGEDIPTSEMWVSPAAMTAFESAIELAETKAASPKFNDEALAAAQATLENAKTIFVGAQRRGKKTSSSSGGGSSDNVPSTGGGSTVTNSDGSKTTTKTNSSTGAVTETTTWPNGDKQVVVTEKDGTKTETVTKKDGTKTETVTKPDGSSSVAVTDAKGIKTETATSASGETTAKVTLPKNVDKTVVTIPVKDVTDGTVAVIVDAKGNETVIKTSMPGEAGLELLVTGNVSVKIKDNAKTFQDIDNGYWAKGAVDFVSSREIFKGVTDVTFAPTELVNRGMMATVLYRLADAKAEGENVFFDVPDGNWYTDAVVWANRSGVVNGYADGTFGPADAVTREQMAAMLFRYAKVMGMDVTVKGDMSKFGDANDVSSWASEAMTWCVGVGLINGVADPATGTTLSPAKTASRAEVATIMQRMVKLMMK